MTKQLKKSCSDYLSSNPPRNSSFWFLVLFNSSDDKIFLNLNLRYLKKKTSKQYQILLHHQRHKLVFSCFCHIENTIKTQNNHE